MYQEALPGIDWEKWREAVNDVEALRARLVRRQQMTQKERRKDNALLKAEAATHKTSWGKTVQCTPLLCAHCLAGLTSEKAMDRHRDETGHRRFYVELEEEAL